jgi:hypothetical protein
LGIDLKESEILNWDIFNPWILTNSISLQHTEIVVMQLPKTALPTLSHGTAGGHLSIYHEKSN